MAQIISTILIPLTGPIISTVPISSTVPITEKIPIKIIITSAL